MSPRTITLARNILTKVAFQFLETTALGDTIARTGLRDEVRTDYFEVVVGDTDLQTNLTPEVDLQQTGFQQNQTAYVTTRANFRAGPSMDAEIYSVLQPGTAVTVLDPVPQNGFVHVRFGEREGWIHQSLLSEDPLDAPAPPAPQGGSQVGFVGANYTTIWNEPNPEAIIAELAQQGVDTIRIWPFYGTGSADDMAERAALVAEIAARYNVRVVIDFMNGFEGGGMELYNNATEELHTRMRAIVDRCSSFGNIEWSIGNELQAGVPSEGEQFTDWYIDQVEFLRRVLREEDAASRTVVGEFTPGAVGHPDNDPAAEARIRRMAAALDRVSIHWYPAYGPEMLDVPAGGDQWLADFQRDWRTIEAWQRAEGRITIGEFAIDGDPNPDPRATQGPYRNPQSLIAWLDYLANLGWVDQVNLWQYGSVGHDHIDGLSYDRWDGPYDDVRAALVEEGYLR